MTVITAAKIGVKTKFDGKLKIPLFIMQNEEIYRSS